MNTKNSLIAITSLTATFVALTAAFFSVSGIAKLFAGASLSVLIMASSLELGKIVAVSFLYQFWEKIPKILKGYLTAASVVLMLITSLGIYGYLSGAYQVTADKLGIIDQEIGIIDLRKQRYQEELNLSIQERDRLSTNIQELSKGLANNTIQYRDGQTGQIITTTSSATRSALQQQLTVSTQERTRLAGRVEALSDSIAALEIQALEKTSNNDIAAEVGPLRFISDLTGISMNMVVNIFALLIVFVFDPLAVALVISVNFLLKQKNVDSQNINNSLESPTTIKVSDETFDKITDLVDNPPEPTEELKTLLNTEEPYKVYSTETYSDDLNKFLDLNGNGVPDWMEPGFDWDNTEAWINNPIARVYKKQIIDKNR